MAPAVRTQSALMLTLMLSLVMAQEVQSLQQQTVRQGGWLRRAGPINTSRSSDVPHYARKLQTDQKPNNQNAEAPESSEQEKSSKCPEPYKLDGLPEGGTYSGDNAVTYGYPQDSLGYLVDFCARPETDCGKVAADAFCGGEGFTRALLYVKDSGAGFRCRPTRYINDPGLFCSCSERESCICDGFEFITCIQES